MRGKEDLGHFGDIFKTGGPVLYWGHLCPYLLVAEQCGISLT